MFFFVSNTSVKIWAILNAEAEIVKIIFYNFEHPDLGVNKNIIKIIKIMHDTVSFLLPITH